MQVPVRCLRGNRHEFLVASRQSIGGSVLAGMFDQQEWLLCQIAKAHGISPRPVDFKDGLFG